LGKKRRSEEGDILGLFGNLKGQRGTKGGNWFDAGHHVVEIQRVKQGETRKKVGMVAIECKVIDSSVHKAGELCSQIITNDKDPAAGNWADFLRVGYWEMSGDDVKDLPSETGKPPTEADHVDLTEEMESEVIGEGNLFAGLQLGLTTFVKPTQSGGKFTRHIWKSVGEARELIATARAGSNGVGDVDETDATEATPAA